MNLNKILTEILHKIENDSIHIIVIDGRGGSGKSTFAKLLTKVIPNTFQINLDEYQLDSADLFTQENIKNGFNIKFENRVFDIPRLQEILNLNANKVVILEGCFSFKNLSNIKADFRIWIDIDKKIARERLNAREIADRNDIKKEVIELSTKKYQESEDRYIENYDPISRADMIVQDN